MLSGVHAAAIQILTALYDKPKDFQLLGNMTAALAIAELKRVGIADVIQAARLYKAAREKTWDLYS